MWAMFSHLTIKFLMLVAFLGEFWWLLDKPDMVAAGLARLPWFNLLIPFLAGDRKAGLVGLSPKDSFLTGDVFFIFICKLPNILITSGLVFFFTLSSASE